MGAKRAAIFKEVPNVEYVWEYLHYDNHGGKRWTRMTDAAALETIHEAFPNGSDSPPGSVSYQVTIPAGVLRFTLHKVQGEKPGLNPTGNACMAADKGPRYNCHSVDDFKNSEFYQVNRVLNR